MWRKPSDFTGRATVLLVVGVIHLSAVSCLAQEPQLSAAEVEQKVLDSRKDSCQRGHVVLHCVNRSKTRQETEFEFDIKFDGEKLRFDRKSRLLGARDWAGPERYVVTESHYIEDVGPEVVVTTGRRNAGVSRPYENAVFHPRALGMTVTGTTGMIRGGLGELIGRTDRDMVVATPEQIGDLATVRLNYRFKSGADASLWIVPSRSYSVLRAETRLENEHGAMKQSVVSELVQYSEGSVWYPSRSEQELSINGEWQEREIITVKEATFGIPIEPSVFTLESFGLPLGRTVLDDSSGVPVWQVWNGEKTRRMTIRDTEAIDTPNASASSLWRWVLIGNAILCAVLACFLIRRLLRRHAV